VGIPADEDDAAYPGVHAVEHHPVESGEGQS
jgi:hypothetical protein